MKQLIIILPLALAAACAADLPRYPEGRPQGAVKSFDATGGGEVEERTEDLCSFDGLVAVVSFDLTLNTMEIPADDLYVRQGNDQRSLCDLLSDSDYSTAIFQFAGVACTSCQEEAEILSGMMEESEASGEIGHFVIFTDYPGDYEDENYRWFLESFAPYGVGVHDDDMSLWRYFSEDPEMPKRPTYVAMNLARQGVVINNEEADYREIFKAAQELAASVREE